MLDQKYHDDGSCLIFSGPESLFTLPGLKAVHLERHARPCESP